MAVLFSIISLLFSKALHSGLATNFERPLPNFEIMIQVPLGQHCPRWHVMVDAIWTSPGVTACQLNPLFIRVPSSVGRWQSIWNVELGTGALAFGPRCVTNRWTLSCWIGLLKFIQCLHWMMSWVLLCAFTISRFGIIVLSWLLNRLAAV